jgi:serine/threonine protein kinase
MTTPRANAVTEESIFAAAIKIAHPAERSAFLEHVCAGRPDVQSEVEQLLAAHAGSNLLDQPPVPLEQTGAYTPSDDAADRVAVVGACIGPYKLLEKIGEGGMGEVWVADQAEPIKRRVALKLIKPGMDSRSVLARFEAERQALAVMDHPNIAKVLDAGTTPDGRPYFVMELVKGTPITEFADARKLTPKERLELFLPVCQAIQHAHMKGIIHRDIKPSNVLVALHDERPVPKVIDFGVAKAVGQHLTEKTIYTGFGSLVGTPAYMAPEQATFNQLDVDTRADVYALGVLLYELLAGSPPIEAERLKRAALDEVLRIVRDEEPPRPSQRLSTSQMKASIAATRGSEPLKLSQLMRGELDWIVMKALEKDRTRRYDTANGFAADIQRYLAGEQVQAVPPSLGYRLKKAYRRNRAAVLVGMAFLGLIVGAAVMGAVLAIQARRAEAIAEAKRFEAEEQTKKAERLFATNSSTQEAYLEAAVEAEIRNNGSRLDADLLEYKSDARVGLLRLARPLKDGVGPIKSDFPAPNSEHFMGFKDDHEFVKLREFQTAAVIAAGQEFVPLLPSFEAEYPVETSTDGRLLLAGQERTGIELVAIPSLKRIGVLREGTERLVKWGFSPDSKTIFTQDTDTIVRFWNTDGTFRAKTPLRPDRFVYPTGMTIEEVRKVANRANPVLVADAVAGIRSQQPAVGTSGKDNWHWKVAQQTGPTDLFSTRTGQLIRRLDRPGWKTSDFQVEESNRWFIYQEAKDTVCQGVIISADDGRELARLDLAVSTNSPSGHRNFSISPTRQWMMAWQELQPEPGSSGKIDPKTVQLWRCRDWEPVQDSALTHAIAADKRELRISFLTDDLLQFYVPEAYTIGFHRIGQPGSWTPRAEFERDAPGLDSLIAELGGKLFRDERTLYTLEPLQRLNPPRGRKYHPDLAKLAPDGRFFGNLDTVTEKELPVSFAGKGMSGFGRWTFKDFWIEIEEGRRGYDGHELHLLPDPKRLNFPQEMLELWVQVVTGGELGTDGRFQPWDEPTWAAKQKQLAAMKPPYADFPFPGWAATEPNLWYRIQANRTTGQERENLLDEWRRRTGRVHPHDVKDPWRTPGPAAAP